MMYFNREGADVGDDGLPLWVGYLSCIIAGLLWGSNFVPVVSSRAVFKILVAPLYQLCFSSLVLAYLDRAYDNYRGIWVTGFCVYVIRASQSGTWTFPQFEPFAMLGGFLWCTGNMMTVPIIQCIGLGVGLFLWSTVSLFLGWLTGTLGLFGLIATTVYIQWLNYLGAALALASGIAFALIKPNKQDEDVEVNAFGEEAAAFMINNAMIPNPAIVDDDKSWVQKLSLNQQRILGVVLALFAGCAYGTNFTPPQWIMDNCKRNHLPCSQNGLDYVFSHFCGIYLTSTAYFLLYCMLKKNKPFINNELTFPAFISGVMWATAQSLAFLGSSAVGFVISFPIFSTIPGLIGSLWGIIVFKEISGIRNYLAFALAALLVIASVVSVTLSQALKPANHTNATDYFVPLHHMIIDNTTVIII